MAIEWGLLWLDSEGTLEERVRRAATRYKEKYGRTPDACFVPSDLLDEGVVIDNVHVAGNPTVLKDHLWIGEGI